MSESVGRVQEDFEILPCLSLFQIHWHSLTTSHLINTLVPLCQELNMSQLGWTGFSYLEMNQLPATTLWSAPARPYWDFAIYMACALCTEISRTSHLVHILHVGCWLNIGTRDSNRNWKGMFLGSLVVKEQQRDWCNFFVVLLAIEVEVSVSTSRGKA